MEWIIRARIRVTLALIILSYPLLSTPKSFSEVFLYKEKRKASCSGTFRLRKKKLLI
jgi:hypothetical protein